MNVVMTGAGGFVELQGTAEGATFSRAEMDALLALAGKGIRELVAAQRRALATPLTGCGVRLVLASNNAKKLAELDALFAPLGLELVAQGALGIDEAEEPHATFVENALAKARHAARAPAARRSPTTRASASTRSAARPASHRRTSRRRRAAARRSRGASPRARTHANNRAAARAAARRRRSARALRQHAGRAARAPTIPSRWSRSAAGTASILEAPRGSGGFGYDPLMYIPALGRTVAELDAAAKNRHSHPRARCARGCSR